MRNFNPLLPTAEKINGHKINEDIEYLKNITNQVDSIDNYRMFHSTTIKYT